MPLDGISTPASRPLRDWIDHLKRRKLAAKKTRAIVKKRRAVSEQRLCRTEQCLVDIIDGADLIGKGPVETHGWSCGSGVYLLVALPMPVFDTLCKIGADLEDLEDTHDAEPEVDEHTLGRTERLMQPEEFGQEDREPSLGSTGMTDQRRWSEGTKLDEDYELDRAEDEPSTGADTLELDPCDLGEQKEYHRAPDEAIIEEARCRFAAASGSEVTATPARDPDGGPGAWLLLQARGGAK
jgi:hypothetical protein